MVGDYIFISYSYRDEDYVRELARRLQSAGLKPWYFTESQRAGVNWPQRLIEVITQARAVLVVISRASNSPEAEYVLAEVILAQRERTFIVPLRIEPCSGPIDIILAARNWLQVSEGNDPLPKIVDAITNQTLFPMPAFANEYARLIVDHAFVPYARQPDLSLEPPASAALVELPARTLLAGLGRDPRCELVFSERLRFVSRHHARVFAQQDDTGVAFLLADWRSSHGIYVNGERLTGPQALDDGDQIGLGTSRCMLIFSRVQATGEHPTSLQLG